MQDEETDSVRANRFDQGIGQDGTRGVAGRLCAGGAQGGAVSRDRDGC